MPDPIRPSWLSKYFDAHGIAPADASKTKGPQLPAQRTIRATPTRSSLPEPQGGIMGGLLSIGEGVHNAIAGRAKGYSPVDAAKDLYTQSGAKDIVQGLGEADPKAIGLGALALGMNVAPELKAASRFAPAAEAAFREVEPGAFHSALSQFAKERPSEAGFITWRSPDEMRAEKMKTFLSPDEKTGYAIHPESGDIRNVFNYGEKGRGAHAVADALANQGGKVLDAFDTNLGNFYRDMGFKETWRSPWDDQYRPGNWDAKYGTPDVIGMEHPLAGKANADELLAQYDANRATRRTVAPQTQTPEKPAFQADSVLAPRFLSAESTDADERAALAALRAGGHRGGFEDIAEAALRLPGGHVATGPSHLAAALDAGFPFGRVPEGTTDGWVTRDSRHFLTRDEVEGLDASYFSEDRPPRAFVPERPASVAGALPPQKDLRRFIGPKIPADRIQAVEDEAHKTYTSPQFLEWLKSGAFGDWYDTKGTQSKAIDALGDQEGPGAFRDLMEKMGATTARSDPNNNLRRASYYRGLDLAGLVDPEALRAGDYKQVPTGMGHFAQGAHHKALANLVENGGIDPIVNPKPASFVENLTRNFRPYTNDTRMVTGTAMLNPNLIDMGAIVKTAGKDGAVGYTPRNWAYAPMERAAQRAAGDAAGRGMLDIPAGADPTAFWQAKIWDALGPVTGGSRSAGTFDDIFNAKLDKAAQMWGVTPGEANSLFWQGHPFDLPLGSNLIPSRINKGLLQVP